MKLASRSTASKVTWVALLLVCMVGSSAEAYFCPDCDPARGGSALSPGPSGCSPSRTALTNDQGAAGDESALVDVCPVCQSPSHVVTSYTPTLLAFNNGTLQDPPCLSGDIAGFIYKPPRTAS